MLEMMSDQLQCIIGDTSVISDAIPFGSTQYPKLWDYADNIDVMRFLLTIE